MPNGSVAVSASSTLSARPPGSCPTLHRLSALVVGQRDLLRRRAGLLVPGLERLAVAADVLAVAPPSASSSTSSPAAVDELAAHLGADPHELALAELARLALDHQRERAREHEVDLLLGGVAVDAPALAGAEQDLVEAEARHARASRRSGTNRSSVSGSSAA